MKQTLFTFDVIAQNCRQGNSVSVLVVSLANQHHCDIIFLQLQRQMVFMAGIWLKNKVAYFKTFRDKLRK